MAQITKWCDHSSRVTHPECMNKASGADRIPGDLFQILKDDAVKVLCLVCQQI